jgi:formaldehyde-activating enzyme involved in methanogenesis
VIGNDGLLLKAEANPYMMKDRPVVAYQDDTIPNRFWGRGTVEKAYNMQKAIDAQLRSHLDSLALTTAPMIAMDATRLPRGAKFEVKPGKAILTNGAPSEILFPFKFGETSQNNALAAQEFERMLLQATGTLDSQGMVSQATRDGGGQQMSMAMGAIIKKYKRTLTNFQEDFLVPLIKKAAFRYMQFDPERYPSVDMKFIPTATLGIMAREYEQQQLIGLLQTLGPDTPVLPIILKGIISNSSLSNRAEMEMALEQMSQPNPEAQQMQQMAQQMQMEQAQAQTASLQARAQRDQAEAQKTVVETQLLPEELKAKVISSLSTNIEGDNQDKEFEKRAKIAELMLKEKDINNKGKIVELQMQKNNNLQ